MIKDIVLYKRVNLFVKEIKLIDYFFIMQERIHFICLIFRRAGILIFSYSPIFDTNTDEEMQTGSCAAVDIVDKKNLPAGNYEEQDSFIVGDRIYQGLADAVEPVTGITNGAEKTAQSFLVNGSLELNEDENNEGLDTAVQIMVQVDAYQTLNRPVIDTRWTRGITNYAMIIS